MLWLFGQIWLWLLLAFALGVALTVLVLAPWRRRLSREPAGESDFAEAEGFGASTERTELLVPISPPPGPPESPAGYPEDEPTEPPDHGHREGTLPGREEWHARNEWPDEHDVPEAERQWQPRQGG
ncbi:hypothetical protein B0I33_102442 [Prauserella shujinwangii]|uniref:Uncharacterized protein n=1 Tax=Prauserella shujinwangii TaxID=1453103 RepID=A0A2T0M160_9PSEU|nr:hypothetical protein [Prauserella shujinwangii]PRX50321.1 hypothetical protein B0I33_102442 [Prauserella shujinwangii]